MAKTEKQDKPAIHTLKLTRGAIEVAKALARRGEWYEKDPDDYDIVCALQEHPIFTSQCTPRCPHKLSEYIKSDEVRAIYLELKEQWEEEVLGPWQDEVVEHTLEEEERDALKNCIKFFKKKAALGATTHMLSLLRALGLTKR